jgi:hypothetical protein
MSSSQAMHQAKPFSIISELPGPLCVQDRVSEQRLWWNDRTSLKDRYEMLILWRQSYKNFARTKAATISQGEISGILRIFNKDVSVVSQQTSDVNVLFFL